MNISELYLSLPHDLSGSISKNRFRLELLWGVGKMLELMEENQEFSIVFDYVCDIEIHYTDKFDFYQIKTHKGFSSYTANRLTKIEGENSILGRLYLLANKTNNKNIKAAVVSNVPYNNFPSDKIQHRFQDIQGKDKTIIINALQKELNLEFVDLSCLFYIYTDMNLENPEEVLLGKIVAKFEKIKSCEPQYPNALYRLIVDTVTQKACYEFSSDDYDEIVRCKGLTSKQFDEILEKYAENSVTGIQEATKYIESLPSIRKRKEYKKALPEIVKLLANSKVCQEIEKDMAILLDESEIGNCDINDAIKILISNFDKRFPLEISQTDRNVFCLVIIMRYENGAYDHENILP